MITGRSNNPPDHALGLFLHCLKKRRNQIHRQREHNGIALLAGDADERLHVTQLQRLRALRNQLRGLNELRRRLEFAIGVDDLGAPLALGLGLLRDRAHHRRVDVDVLDFDARDLDAPGVGGGIENLLDVDVELVALGQHLVELVLAEYRTQRRLRQLTGGVIEILDLDNGALRIDHTEIHHRVDLDRDVVTRDHVLRWHVHHHHAQVDLHHLLNAGDQDNQARTLDLPEPAKLEHHAALVLAQDAKRGNDERDDDEKYEAG